MITKTNIGTDSAERLRQTHEAVAYDKWLTGEIQDSIDDPRPGIPNEEVKRHFADRREALQKRIEMDKV